MQSPLECRATPALRAPLETVWRQRARPFTAVVLILLLFWMVDPLTYLQAAEQLDTKQESLGPSAAAELHEAATKARALIPALRSTRQADRLNSLGDGLGEHLKQISELILEVRGSLLQLGHHLRSAGLPQLIIDRQRAELSKFESRTALFGNLRAAVDKASRDARRQLRGGKAGGPAAAALGGELDRLEDYLSEMLDPPTLPPAFDPLKLPHRMSELEPVEPRLNAVEFTEMASTGAAQSPAGEATVQGLGAKASLPGPEDLAETIDVQFTPAITARASELGNDPIRIFDFVRNAISFVPTTGSIQGAGACLDSKLCNATDTASLLIALLRTSGIPARYASGTIEAPIDQIMSLAGGFSDPQAALTFMSSAGTPTVGLSDGVSLVSGRFEHTWVEAFLDYVPSRGAVAVAGDTWVPLDPSFKQLDVVPGIDLAAAAGFDSLDFLQQGFDTATIDPTNGALSDLDVGFVTTNLETVKNQILAFADSEGVPSTLRDLAGGTRIREQRLTLLPASLPYRVLVRAGSFAELPSSLRHQLRFEVTSSSFGFLPDLTFGASMPQLAGRKITLSYGPASDADRDTMLSFAPADDDAIEDFPSSLPAYLIRVHPELRIEGEVVATGAAVTLGESGNFRLVLSGPGRNTDVVNNAVTAGTYNAIVLNLGIPGDSDERRGAAQQVLDLIVAGNTSGLDKDDIMGEYLHAGGLTYWSQLAVFSNVLKGSRGIATARLPSEGIFTYALQTFFFFGTPNEVRSGSLATDVDTDLQAVVALDGDRAQAIGYLAQAGANASRQESEIWDLSISDTPTQDGISTMAYLDEAVRRNIPIFHITRDNLATALPQLSVSSLVRNEIVNSVNAGREVTIPQRQFELDGFSGVGLVVFDPATGSGAYLIASGLAGGGFRIPPIPGGSVTAAFLGMLLVAVGAFAALAGLGVLALIAGIAGIALAIYDAIDSYQGILEDNPGLGPAGRNAVGVVLAMAAIIVVTIGVFALFASGGTAIALLAVIGFYWAINALIMSSIAVLMGRIFGSLGMAPDTVWINLQRWLLRFLRPPEDERFDGFGSATNPWLQVWA